MSGVVLLLAICVAGIGLWGVVIAARLRQPSDERLGYYGTTARRRRLDVDATEAELEALEQRSALDDLASLVVVLDRLAWHGVPVVRARRAPDDAAWTIDFRDGTTVTVHTDDVGAMRRAAVLSHSDPLVVSHVHPDGSRARVVLWAPRHGPVAVSVAP